MDIKIIVTGGTFDKEYNELNGSLFFRNTHLDEMLELGRNHHPVKIEVLMMIDSLDMTTRDRQIILDNIKKCKEDRIIITHGTDTMVETASFLAKECNDKTIVLTGAMIPYKFGSSDGLFNLGSAIAFVQTLSNGVYITMNGRYLTHDNCYKDKEKGCFENIR